MKNALNSTVAIVCLLMFNAHVSNGLAQGTAFTYQGCLNNAGSPASGSYDFTFTVFSGNSTSSSLIGITQTNLALAVSNGLFTATLDFGTVFTGTPAWLAIGVRGMGESDFTILNPLQPVTPTPYAIYAPNAGAAASVATNGVVPLGALPIGVVTNGAAGVSISGLFGGTFAGDGSALTNLPATGAGSGTAANYVSAHDDAIGNGTLASGQTKAISFSAITMNGWTCAGDNATFTCSQSGVYLVCYYALVINYGANLGIVASNSRTGQIGGSGSYSGNSGRLPFSQCFLASFNAGDQLQIQATAAGASALFVGPVGFTGPDANLTIIQVH